MNFKSILKEIEKTDPEVFVRPSTRRGALKSFGSKVALAALPLAVGSLFKKAYAQTTGTTAEIAALNFVLQLEYLQYNFYETGNSVGFTGTFIPEADVPGLITIEAHQKAHILLLNSVITGLGGTPYTPPYYDAHATNPLYIPTGAYDFTAGGAYAHVWDTYSTFLTIAQVIEDTCIHAYKGQVSNFLGNTALLTQLFQLQSCEGRHAAHIRLIRRNLGNNEIPAPWITNNIPPTPVTATEPQNQFHYFYDGEDNTVQLNNIDITTLPDTYASGGTVPKISATAAFDEEMSSTTVLSSSLLGQFILS